MKKIIKIILGLLVVLAFVGTIVFFGYGSAEEQYQHDVDIIRLNDLEKIGAYVEEYKEKAGSYPFQSLKHEPVYVHIAALEQQDAVENGEGPPHKVHNIHVSDFIAELERVLVRRVEMPFDPQRGSSGRQNWYVYMTYRNRYFLGVHLYHPYPFAQKIGENWYKVEVSNVAQASIPIWDYEALMVNIDFQEAKNEEMLKSGALEGRRSWMSSPESFSNNNPDFYVSMPDYDEAVLDSLPASERCQWLVEKESFSKAFSVCKKEAMAGEAEAFVRLGNMYAKGQGVKQSYGEAYIHYSFAAALGDDTGRSLKNKVGEKLDAAFMKKADESVLVYIKKKRLR